MGTSYNISLYSLFFYFLLLVIPLWILYHLRVKKVKQGIISVVRMTIQMFLVGIYLKYLFELDNVWVNMLWVLVMIVIANSAILKQSGLQWKKCVVFTLPAHLLTAAITFISLLIIFDLSTLCSARYLIPLEGMVMGNIMRTNVIALDRFFSELKRRRIEYIQYITLGASLTEAIRPFFQTAMQAAIGPQIATIATMGLVFLPGMMTGQILGGVPPAIAVSYQIMIMIAIFASAVLSVFLSIRFGIFRAFDAYDRIRQDIFVDD